MPKRTRIGMEAARAARKRAKPRIESLKARILRELHNAGRRGMTSFELYDSLNADLDLTNPEHWKRRAIAANVTSAIGGMKNDGRVIETGRKRTNDNGNPASVVALAEAFPEMMTNARALHEAKHLRKLVSVRLQDFTPEHQVKLAKRFLKAIDKALSNSTAAYP